MKLGEWQERQCRRHPADAARLQRRTRAVVPTVKGQVRCRGGCAVNTRTKRLLFWSPRIIGILFGLFLSLFALDVFGVGLSVWDSIRAFLIHLVPVYVVFILLAFAWRWEWVGAVGFAALGLIYIVWGWGMFPWVAYVTISGPLFLLAALFLLNWIYRKDLRTP
jgi:hypothetical protein